MYDIRSRSWHTLGSWTTIVWNIIQIQHGREELWSEHGIWVCVHCDLDLGSMTLGQGHDTPLGHGQELCEISSRTEKGLRSNGPETMWTDRQTDRQTDGQTDGQKDGRTGRTDRQTDRQGDSYIPPNFVCGGYNNRRTCKHATKPRAPGLLGHSVRRTVGKRGSPARR